MKTFIENFKEYLFNKFIILDIWFTIRYIKVSKVLKNIII